MTGHLVVSDEELEAIRQPHESNKEWNLRRGFILAHREKDFSQNRLLCLAACFVNCECYGSRYPADVMRLVKELSEEISEDVEAHRQELQERNSVKFVKSGDSEQV